MPQVKPIIMYESMLNDCTPTATSTATDYNVLNLRDLRLYMYWMATSAATQYITCPLASAQTANCLVIIGHNLATVGATISVEYSSDNFAADINTALSGFTVTTDKVIMRTFTQQSAEYWRLKLTGMSAAPYMAILMIDNMLQFPYPEDAPYTPFKDRIKGETQRSRRGHHLGSAVDYQGIQITANFSNLSRTFIFDTYRPFWDYYASQLKPFFYAADIGTFPDLVFFVKVPDDETFGPPMSKSELVDRITLNMEGLKEAS
jgi:hypothetical protein